MGNRSKLRILLDKKYSYKDKWYKCHFLGNELYCYSTSMEAPGNCSCFRQKKYITIGLAAEGARKWIDENG